MPNDLPRTVILAAVCAALVGCTPPDGGTDESPPAGTPLAVEASPQLSVGVLEGDPMEELYRVVTPFRLPDGSLVVPLAGTQSIRVFGPDGDFMEELGGPGEGPGEFASLGAAWARGDAVEAFDSRLIRITRFLPDGTVEVVTLDRIPSAQSAVPGPLADGWAVMGVATAGLGRRDVIVVHRFSGDGSHLGEIARVQGMARYGFPGGGGGPHPLSPRARLAVGGGRIYLADTLEPRMRILDGSGDRESEIVWHPDDAPSPDAAFRLVVDSAAARAGPEREDEVRAQLGAAPRPEAVSTFWEFLVDPEGFVWVRPYEPLRHAVALGASPAGGPGPGGEWVVLDPEGERVGTVTVPAGFEPLRIERDAVIGVHRDEWDVEVVRVHALQRQGW